MRNKRRFLSLMLAIAVIISFMPKAEVRAASSNLGSSSSPSVNDYRYFYYNGSVQSFTVPVTGSYKIEAWGAKGGYDGETYRNDISYGGAGGYTTATFNLTKGMNLYIVCGGAGENNSSGVNSYNGGGAASSGGYSGGGGGATHVATKSGVLSSFSNASNASNYVLLVAGGGGGGSGFGDELHISGGAGNASSGTSSFGKGQDCIGDGGGGGGGWYGGIYGLDLTRVSGGGTGYVNSTKFTVTSSSIQTGGNSGNGYAKITILGIDVSLTYNSNDTTGSTRATNMPTPNPEAYTVISTKAFTVKGNPTRAGYTFNGWKATVADSTGTSGKVFNSGDTITLTAS